MFIKIYNKIMEHRIAKQAVKEFNEFTKMTSDLKDDVSDMRERIDFLFDKEKQKSKLFEICHFALSLLILAYLIFVS